MSKIYLITGDGVDSIAVEEKEQVLPTLKELWEQDYKIRICWVDDSSATAWLDVEDEIGPVYNIVLSINLIDFYGKK